VLTRDEVVAILTNWTALSAWCGLLLYGSGMRLLEGLSVKDLDFGLSEIIVRHWRYAGLGQPNVFLGGTST
jgi:hypothetical protein